MATPPPRAAGMPLALLILAGAAIGAALHQPTIGMLAGTMLGIAIAILLWLHDRRHR